VLLISTFNNLSLSLSLQSVAIWTIIIICSLVLGISHLAWWNGAASDGFSAVCLVIIWICVIIAILSLYGMHIADPGF